MNRLTLRRVPHSIYAGAGIVVVLLLAIVLLRWQGRLWMCECGRIDLWTADTSSADSIINLIYPFPGLQTWQQGQ